MDGLRIRCLAFGNADKRAAKDCRIAVAAVTQIIDGFGSVRLAVGKPVRIGIGKLRNTVAEGQIFLDRFTGQEVVVGRKFCRGCGKVADLDRFIVDL